MSRARRPASRREYGTGSITRRPDGRLEAAFRLPGGRRLSKYGTVREGERARPRLNDWLADCRRQLERGTLPDARRWTLGEYLEHWRADHPEWDARTHKLYRVRLAMFGPLHATPLHALSAAQIERRINELITSGDYARSTVANARVVLSIALRAAVRPYRLLEHNPVTDTRPPKVPERRKTILSSAEARRYLEAAERTVGRDGDLALIALETGLRSGELRGLRWGDILGPRIAVRRQIDRSGRVEKRPKTDAGARIVGISRQLATRLELRRASADAHLFAKRDGSAINATQALLIHHAVCRAAGLPLVRLHDLRHGYATLLRRRGIGIEVVQRVMGHRDLRTTLQLYRSVGDEDVTDATDAMIEALREPER